jgi:hypothetical protein
MSSPHMVVGYDATVIPGVRPWEELVLLDLETLEARNTIQFFTVDQRNYEEVSGINCRSRF